MAGNSYVIIGNSIAGISCIEGIRRVDKEGEIFLFSDEEILNYSKPLISYYLGGRLKEEQLNFREENFYKESNVRCFLNTPVRKIDIKEKLIYTGNESFNFDFLFIGTGGRPIIPEIEDMSKIKQGIFTFTKLDTAKKLKRFIEGKKIKEIVVLGAGLIGLKCTEGLIARGISVKIIDLSDRLLSNTFDLHTSEIIEDKLRASGCEVIKNNTVQKVAGEAGELREVILKDGKRIKTNALVICVGVIPETSVIEGTGIIKNRGIIVNEYMQTNIPFIFAGGDVAEADNFFIDKKSVIAIWPVASRMGKVAGYNMAGANKRYDGLFVMNSIEFFGIPVISFGITNPSSNAGYEVISTMDSGKEFYRKIVIKENKIVGAIYLGKIERAGIISGLIKNKVDVSSFKNWLINDKFGLLVLPEEYRKHIVAGEGIEV